MRLKLSKLASLAVCVVLATVASNCIAQQQDFSPLDHYIQTTMHEWNVPGVAVGIVHGTDPVYLKGFGVRNIETRQPVTPDTLFDIGSCTKAFTSASIAMLVDEGKMNWDDKMDKSIPFFHLYDPLADENVTLRDLLTHRTGLPGADLLWYGAPVSREQIVRSLAYIHPDAGFRTVFQYQNAMYVTLGYAVGQVSGGTWDDFVKRRIFQPLGMSESDTSAIDAQKSPDYASPHVMRNGKVVVIPWKNIDNAGPAGSINSSVRDMAKWISLQLNDGVFDGKRLISSKNIQEMHRPQIVLPPGEIPTVFFPDSMQLSYGLGWFIQDYRGHQLVLHPGDIDGFEALTVLIPEIHTGYEVLVNLGGNSYRQALGYHIADVLLHLPEEDWSAHFKANDAKFEAEEKAQTASWESKRNPNTHPSHELSAYVGRYNNPAYGEAGVSMENGHLALRFHAKTSQLGYFQYDTFLIHFDLEDRAPTRLTFSQNSNGEISEFVMAGIHFQRIKK
ncbi:MAG TPA: serine hydrolase [Acidobacteriaceae bacterium]|nr:serine hydrolase [Acidobacteriaceae bacterium]